VSDRLFYLTDDQRMIRDLARKVARERIAPHAAHYDETETYPEESMKAIVESGLFGVWVPEAYGGSDMGCLALALVAEEIAWACAATGTQFIDQPLGGLPILLAGTEEQKKKYLPRLAAGEERVPRHVPRRAVGGHLGDPLSFAARRVPPHPRFHARHFADQAVVHPLLRHQRFAGHALLG